MTFLIDQAALAAPRSSGSSFKYDARRGSLVAQAFVLAVGPCPPPSGQALIEALNQRLRETARTFSFDAAFAHFELDAGSGTIYLARAFPLENLTFSDLLFSLRRLERVASRCAASERVTRLREGAIDCFEGRGEEATLETSREF